MKRAAGWGRVAFWASCALAFGVGCQLIIDTDRLSDRRCSADEKPCENLQSCVSISDFRTGCGNVTCAPCVLANAFAECSPDYRCQIRACHGGYDSCNPDASAEDGCETEIGHDPNNCGGCGRRCLAVPNGFRGCADGGCVLGGCELGYADCDDSLTNGCETNIWRDERCGQGCSAVPCPDGQHCSQGTCR